MTKPGLRHYSEAKRQEIEPVEKNIRASKKEQGRNRVLFENKQIIILVVIEREWSPENLDIDFSLFDNKVYTFQEQKFECDILDNEFPIARRAFNTEQFEIIDNEESTVEHGHPREIGMLFFMDIK